MKAELNALSWVLRYRTLYQVSRVAVAILLPGFATGVASAAATSREILREAQQLSEESFRMKRPADWQVRQERFKRFDVSEQLSFVIRSPAPMQVLPAQGRLEWG